MRRFRFHLGTLVILVLLLGVSFAALRESNETWDSSIFSMTIGALSISILLAIYRTDRRRAFWLGFALCGSTYLGLTLVPPVESRLITKKVLAYLASKMLRLGPNDIDGWMDIAFANSSLPIPLQVNKSTGTDMTVMFIDQPTPSAARKIVVTPLVTGSSGSIENFVRIGHSLLALLTAFLGGMASRYFFAKNREPDSGPVWAVEPRRPFSSTF